MWVTHTVSTRKEEGGRKRVQNVSSEISCNKRHHNICHHQLDIGILVCLIPAVLTLLSFDMLVSRDFSDIDNFPVLRNRA